MVEQFESSQNSKALVNNTFRRALRGTAVGAAVAMQEPRHHVAAGRMKLHC